MTPEEKKIRRKEIQKRYREKNKDKIKEDMKTYRENNKDKVKTYRENNKDKLKEYAAKYYQEKAETLKNNSKSWRDNNPEKALSRAKKWKEDNKDKVKEYSKEWRTLNRDRINEYVKLRKATDPLFRLSSSIRRNINTALKKQGFSKSGRTFVILGCTFEVLKTHIESLWEPWMTWDNYGLYNGELNYGWDINHIIPQSSAEIGRAHV